MDGGVVIPAGSCSATFTITAVDDGESSAPSTYTVTARASGYDLTNATDTIVVYDGSDT